MKCTLTIGFGVRNSASISFSLDAATKYPITVCNYDLLHQQIIDLVMDCSTNWPTHALEPPASHAIAYIFYIFNNFRYSFTVVRHVKPQQNQGITAPIFAVEQNLCTPLRIISPHFVAEQTAASLAAAHGTPLMLTPAAD